MSSFFSKKLKAPEKGRGSKPRLFAAERSAAELEMCIRDRPRYIQDELYLSGMQVADIRPGETHTLRNLLNAMLVYRCV